MIIGMETIINNLTIFDYKLKLSRMTDILLLPLVVKDLKILS